LGLPRVTVRGDTGRGHELPHKFNQARLLGYVRSQEISAMMAVTTGIVAVLTHAKALKRQTSIAHRVLQLLQIEWCLLSIEQVQQFGRFALNIGRSAVASAQRVMELSRGLPAALLSVPISLAGSGPHAWHGSFL
jgi:hypothetical protein